MTDVEEISMQKRRRHKSIPDDDDDLNSIDIDTIGEHVYDIEDRKNNTGLDLNHNRTSIGLKWDNITYSVKIRDPKSKKKFGAKKDKIILNNVSGRAKPGELVAIMGPSGSGKTTLLNILSGRCASTSGARLTGYISVNNVNKSQLGSQRFAQISAYVQQDDILFAMQTVKETLMTAARLRLPKDMSYQEKERRVNSIIQELGLTKAQYTHVGDSRHRGISGGERKRTNIGVEMIQDPSLLFLDEPTSGIDSFQALNVIETLKILCYSGVTVIVSVHQPRSSIYQLFDHLILLSEGCVAYDGPAGNTAVNYFSKINLKCPSYFHPGDYFLDIISLDNRSKNQEIKSKQRIKFILEQFATTRSNSSNKNKKLSFDGSIQSLNLDNINNGVTSSIIEQFKILSVRNIRQIIRDKFALTMRIFFTCFFALFLAALWSDTGRGQKDIQNRNGVLFFIAINQSFGGMVNTLQVFILEKAIVLRERQAHSYYLWVYYLTKFFTQLPVEVLFPCIFASILYWIVGLNDEEIWAFPIFILITVLISVASVGIGFMVGSCAPNIDAANAMAPLVIIIAILFGGFYINSDAMPVWLAWLENISTIKWCFEAYCINEYMGLHFNCNDVDEGDPCFEDGDQILTYLSFEASRSRMWQAILILTSLFICFHIIAFSCLKFVTQKYLQVSPPNNNDIHHQNISTILEQNHYGAISTELYVNNNNNNIGGGSDNDDTKKKKQNIKTPLLTT